MGRLNNFGEWRQAISDVQAEVRAEALRARDAGDRLQTDMTAREVEFQARFEELQGYLHAFDKEQSAAVSEVAASQAQAEQRFVEFVDSLPKANEAARTEVLQIIDSNIAQVGQRFETEKLALLSAINDESKTLSEKQAKAVAELHQQIRNVEQDCEKKSQELRETHLVLKQQLETTHTSFGQQLKQECGSISEDIVAQHLQLQQEHEQVGVVARQYAQEITEIVAAQAASRVEAIKALLEDRITAEVASVQTCIADVARKSHDDCDGVAARIVELGSRLQEEACHSDERLEVAIADVLTRMSVSQTECLEEIQDARNAAQRACAEVAEHTGHQFQHQSSESAEQLRALRSDVERGIGSLQLAAAATKEELQSSFERDVAESKQALIARDARLSNEVAILRDSLEGQIVSQGKRVAQLDERFEEKMLEFVEDAVCALRAQCIRTQETCTALESDLRGAITQGERRLQSMVDDESRHVAELVDIVTKLRAEGVANRDRVHEALTAVLDLANSSTSEAKTAQARASAMEDAVRTFDKSVAELRHAKMREQEDFMAEMRTALSSLANGVVRIAQCCGFVGNLEDAPSQGISGQGRATRLHTGQIGVQDLLNWEKTGVPLVERIERGWIARVSTQSDTLLGLVQQKADASVLRVLQNALRDLDVRLITYARGEHGCGRRFASARKDTGEPFVGSTPVPNRKNGPAHIQPSTSQQHGISTAKTSAKFWDSIDTMPSCSSLLANVDSNILFSASCPKFSDEQVANSDEVPTCAEHQNGPATQHVLDKPAGPAPTGERPLQRRLLSKEMPCATNNDAQA